MIQEGVPHGSTPPLENGDSLGVVDYETFMPKYSAIHLLSQTGRTIMAPLRRSKQMRARHGLGGPSGNDLLMTCLVANSFHTVATSTQL
jgi:hypothetical protein